MTVRSCERSSFRVKYTCPDWWRWKFDTSPSTHSNGKAVSRASLTIWVAWETVRTFVEGADRSVAMLILDQQLAADSESPAAVGGDLDEKGRQHQPVPARVGPLGGGGQEAGQGLLGADADDRAVASGHPGIGEVGRPAGQDALVGRGHVGMGAD